MGAAWWCSTCGYLLTPAAREDRDPTRGDPMRRDALAVSSTHVCPHCRDRSWIDLGVVSVALRVRDEESALQHRKHARAARGATCLGMMVAGLVLGATIHLVLAWILMPLGLVGLVLSGAAEELEALAFRGVKADRSKPVRRWRRPAVAWARGSRLARGTAHARSSIAPLSGRPAVAWVVAICEGDEDPRDTRFSTTDAGWLLVEQHCEALTIDGTPLASEPVVLAELRPAFLASPTAVEWLRARGFDPGDDLRLFEGILFDGQTVELRANQRGGAPICSARAR
jgi:hypothetical protein